MAHGPLGIFARLIALCVVASLCHPGVSAATDKTLTAGSTGKDVVVASILKLRATGIFNGDSQFLIRLAFVESTFGTKSGFDASKGGIWQVSQAAYAATKLTASTTGLSTKLNSISSSFNIDWASTSYADLQKPLYSCLAARLAIFVAGDTIPCTASSQATTWVSYFYSRYSLTAPFNTTVFVTLVNSMDRVCTASKSDIFFLLDGSGSIASSDFTLAKSFITSVISLLSINPKRVRVGVIQFASSVQLEFHLNAKSSNTAATNAVNQISQLGGSTRTDLALDEVVSRFQSVNRQDEGVPMVAVVLTDGQSTYPSKTVTSATAAHNSGIVVYAIGIGSGISSSELESIASSKDKRYLQASFSDLSCFAQELSSSSCYANAKLNNSLILNSGKIKGVCNKDSPAYYELTIPSTGLIFNVDLTFNNASASLIIYVSYTNSNPNSAIYDLTFTITASGSAVFIPPQNISSQVPGGSRKRRAVPDGSCSVGFTSTSTSDMEFEVTVSGQVNGGYRMQPLSLAVLLAAFAARFMAI